jgi:tetratricopeptide (TPR) repeat protein
VTLSNISQIYQARGDDDTALRYLEKSLAILRAIDDRAGLCVTLFNIGHIYLDPQQARACLVEAYRIAKEIGHAPILAALENLAKQAGKGLELWEQLSQKWGSGNNPRRANQ